MHSIGTENEKTLHIALKDHFEPDREFQEIRYKSYIADIKRDDRIIEIQTRNLYSLKKKLECYLDDGLDVTVVYPIARKKWIVWVDPKSGEASEKRKSPKTGSIYDCFRELYGIKQLLTRPNLRIMLVLVDVEEHKLLCGWSRDGKKGSVRIERYPVSGFDEFDIYFDEYAKLIPVALPEKFTKKDFMKSARISADSAGRAVNLLSFTGVIEKVGKSGNAIIYQRVI